MARHLRQSLENKAGEERIHFVIPYIFLPPRFANISQERNLFLLFDDDFTLHVRWQGEMVTVPHSLKKREAIRLLKDVCNSMKKYRQDTSVFSRFIEKIAEEPYKEDRHGKFTKEKEAQGATQDRPQEETEQKAEGQETEQSELASHIEAIGQLVNEMEMPNDG